LPPASRQPALDIRIAASHAEFGCREALEHRACDGVRNVPLIVGFSRALELIITGRRIDAVEALRIGLVTEVVPAAKLMKRARELALAICRLPQGAIRADKESCLRGWGRPLDEGLRIEAEMAASMFMREDKHAHGAQSFIDKKKPRWKKGGL
jgi:enoyl-CoA hydratase